MNDLKPYSNNQKGTTSSFKPMLTSLLLAVLLFGCRSQHPNLFVLNKPKEETKLERAKRLKIKQEQYFKNDTLIFEYRYDSLYRHTSRLQHTDITGLFARQDSFYNETGQLIRDEGYLLGEMDNWARKCDYSYNAQGQLLNSVCRHVSSPQADTQVYRKSYTYDDWGRPLSFEIKDPKYGPEAYLARQWIYDPDSQLMGVVYFSMDSLPFQDGYSRQIDAVSILEYDSIGRKIRKYHHERRDTSELLLVESWKHKGDTIIHNREGVFIPYQPLNWQGETFTQNQLDELKERRNELNVHTPIKRQLTYYDKETKLVFKNIAFQFREEPGFTIYKYDANDTLLLIQSGHIFAYPSWNGSEFDYRDSLILKYEQVYSYSKNYRRKKKIDRQPNSIHGKSHRNEGYKIPQGTLTYEKIEKRDKHGRLTKLKKHRFEYPEHIVNRRKRERVKKGKRPRSEETFIARYRYIDNCRHKIVIGRYHIKQDIYKKGRRVRKGKRSKTGKSWVKKNSSGQIIHVLDTPREDRGPKRETRNVYDHKGQKIFSQQYEEDSLTKTEKWRIEYYE